MLNTISASERVRERIGRLTNRTANSHKTSELPFIQHHPTTARLTERVSVSVPDGPGVYAAWLKGVALYIGFGANVWKRSHTRSNTKNGKKRKQAFSEADRLEIYPCGSTRQAIQLEAELIRIYNPKYNDIGHLQGSWNVQQLQVEHAKLFGPRRRKVAA